MRKRTSDLLRYARDGLFIECTPAFPVFFALGWNWRHRVQHKEQYNLAHDIGRKITDSNLWRRRCQAGWNIRQAFRYLRVYSSYSINTRGPSKESNVLISISSHRYDGIVFIEVLGSNRRRGTGVSLVTLLAVAVFGLLVWKKATGRRGRGRT